jgi:preprotein translocase subunit SecD
MRVMKYLPKKFSSHSMFGRSAMRLHQAGTEGSASKEHEALEQKRVRDTQRVPPDRQDVQQFDQLLREGMSADTEWASSEQPRARRFESAEAQSASARSSKRQQHSSSTLDALPQELPPTLLLMLAQAHPQQQTQLAQAAAPATGSQRAQDVIELLRKHVRQLAVSTPVREASGNGKGWMRLNESLLPGTDILLERDALGWRVHARTDSPDSQALMQACAESLQAHFDEAGLGRVALSFELTP